MFHSFCHPLLTSIVCQGSISAEICQSVLFVFVRYTSSACQSNAGRATLCCHTDWATHIMTCSQTQWHCTFVIKTVFNALYSCCWHRGLSVIHANKSLRLFVFLVQYWVWVTSSRLAPDLEYMQAFVHLLCKSWHERC